jgi:hypothetical protein
MACEQLVSQGWSTTTRQTVRQTPTGQKQLAKPIERRHSRTRDEHEEHLDKLHLAEGPRATRGRSARHGNNSSSLKLKKAKPPIRPWISQTAEALEERVGEGVKHP